MCDTCSSNEYAIYVEEYDRYGCSNCMTWIEPRCPSWAAKDCLYCSTYDENQTFLETIITLNL